MSAVDWSKVFGLGIRNDVECNQQNNVIARETLADEMGSDASDPPAGMEEEVADTGSDMGGGDPSMDTGGSDDMSMMGGDSFGDDMGMGGMDDMGGGDFGGGGFGDSGASGFSGMSGNTKAPVGVNPNRTINGKLILSEKIRDLISEVDKTLDAFQKISFKDPVVVNLGELKKEVKLLLEIVPTARNEDIMMRYELYVQNYRELIKKTQKKKS